MGIRTKKCGQPLCGNINEMIVQIGQNENLCDEKEHSVKTELGEFLTQKGAMALAKRLESYWHQKGYVAARFWAEPIGERFEKVGTYEIYRVTSNLVNGIPPRYAATFQPNASGSLIAH
jgi:hypothetical protein